MTNRGMCDGITHIDTHNKNHDPHDDSSPHSIGDLLSASHVLQPGRYRIEFNTTAYMSKCKALHPTFFADAPFYPRVEIYFQVAPHQVNEHFHVPLTWNPYGYSTYRGS